MVWNLGSVTYRHEGCARKSKAGAVLDGPVHAAADRFQKRLQLPAPVAKRADVADRAHRHFDQAAGIDERLGLGLRGHDRVEHLGGRLLHRLAHRRAADTGC